MSSKIIDQSSSDEKQNDLERMDLIEKILKAITSSGDGGIIQTDMCREFSMHSRDGSRLLTSMEKRSMIIREKVLHKGRWTFKLVANKKAELKHKPVDVASVAGAPCISCSYQNLCSDDESSKYSPVTCGWLEEWLLADYEKNVPGIGTYKVVIKEEQK